MKGGEIKTWSDFWKDKKKREEKACPVERRVSLPADPKERLIETEIIKTKAYLNKLYGAKKKIKRKKNCPITENLLRDLKRKAS